MGNGSAIAVFLATFLILMALMYLREHRRIMAQHSRAGYAFNRTRQTFLAREMRVADSHWTRFRGLMATSPAAFSSGQGLWIIPCHGVHTWAMLFPIDVVYLNNDHVVVHVEENLKPWRFASVRMDSNTVLELPSRTVWDSGTKIGDHIELTFKTTSEKGAAA